ncbi:MAG: hypothetical protein JOZ08_20290 [Verrucomicrobia bacterium]|nr:hypothetical protein [Verrucomicrobiota bacterium]
MPGSNPGQATLENGGRDNGGAGVHPEHGQDYFAAFVFDPDGHRIEAVLDERPQPCSQGLRSTYEQR